VADIIVVDRTEKALKLPKNFGIADTVLPHGNEVEKVKELIRGQGAESVISSVAKSSAVTNGLAMIRDAGIDYKVRYGERIEISTMEMVVSEMP